MQKIAKLFSAFLLSAILALTLSHPVKAYEVKPGDTLNSIAKEFGVSADDLAAWNNIQDKNLIHVGQNISVVPNGNSDLSSDDVEILKGFFNAEYYAKQNPDVVEELGSTADVTFKHFLEFGLGELRQPNENFNVAAYAAGYKDLSKAFGTDVLKYYRHYKEFGKAEERVITTAKAFTEAGNDIRLVTMQSTVDDEAGRPQFLSFYQEGDKIFYIAPEEGSEPPSPVPSTSIHAAFNSSTGELVIYSGDALPAAYGQGFNVYEALVPGNSNATNYQQVLPWYNDRNKIKTITIDPSMRGINSFTSTSQWFRNFFNAATFNGFENLDVSNVTDMSGMFFNTGNNVGVDENAWVDVPNVSNWNTSKVTDMSNMFHSFGAYAGGDSYPDGGVKGVPDVSNWDVSNVTSIAGIFAWYAGSDIDFNSVPNVSNWKTGNVTDMSEAFLFYNLYSEMLAVVPDVSNWDTSKVTDMSDLFNGFSEFSLVQTKVPDVSRWNTSNVTDMSYLFSDYCSMGAIIDVVPDVSNWNVSNVTCLDSMFSYYGMRSLVLNAVPDVSNWNTANVISAKSIFDTYASDGNVLTVVPDVSKWDMANCTNMREMFEAYGHESSVLTTVPDISGWTFNSAVDTANMFKQYAYVAGTTPPTLP